MSIRPLIIRTTRVTQNEPCIFCQSRAHRLIRSYAQRARPRPQNETDKSPQDLRREVDNRSRNAWLRLLSADRLILLKPDDANELINAFLANGQNKLPLAANVRKLADREHPTDIGIAS